MPRPPRLSALTIPRLTDWPTPKGLPIARTTSPTSSLSLSPSVAAGRPMLSILMTETSAFVSRPTDDGRLEFLARFAERDFHLVGAVDHVVVREDVAVSGDDDAGAKAVLGLLGQAAAIAGVGNPKVAPKRRVVEKRMGGLRPDFLRGENIDDARCGLLHDARVAHALSGVAVDGLVVRLKFRRGARLGFFTSPEDKSGDGRGSKESNAEYKRAVHGDAGRG